MSFTPSSTPVALNAEVVEKELRHEKHPGKDEVCLLHTGDGRILHVEKSVYDSVEVGSLQKSAWSYEVANDGHGIQLAWSTDFNGMILAGPAHVIVILSWDYSSPGGRLGP